jgi:hypothetical protein
VACLVTGVSGAAGTPALTLQGVAPATGTDLLIYASPQISAGVSYNGNWRYIQHGTHSDTYPLSILSTYTAKFGTLVAGKQVMVKVVQSQAGMEDNGTVFNCIVGS